MSHTLRRMQLSQDRHLRQIQASDLPSFWRSERLPTPLEQADNLIIWMGDNQDTSSTWAEATSGALGAILGLRVSPEGDGASLGWLISALEPKGLFRRASEGTAAQVRMMLTIDGWERYDTLTRQRVESRTAFMAMKFGKPEVDRAVVDCFKPAARRAGFELRVVADQPKAGLIDSHIRAGILAARFVVADLTHGSHGAYWEAGYGEGRGIPVIYTCERTAWEESQTHFDTNHMTTILWNASNLKAAEDELVAVIRATLRAEANQSDG